MVWVGPFKILALGEVLVYSKSMMARPFWTPAYRMSWPTAHSGGCCPPCFCRIACLRTVGSVSAGPGAQQVGSTRRIRGGGDLLQHQADWNLALMGLGLGSLGKGHHIGRVNTFLRNSTLIWPSRVYEDPGSRGLLSTKLSKQLVSELRSRRTGGSSPSWPPAR